MKRTKVKQLFFSLIIVGGIIVAIFGYFALAGKNDPTIADDEKTTTSKVNSVPVTGVKILPRALALDKGDTASLKGEIKPETATNKKVKWESDDPTVVSVTQEGEIEALKEGEVLITMTTEDGHKTAECSVTVDP